VTVFNSASSQHVTGVVRDGFRNVHDRIRELIRGLDMEALNWRPHPEANSIAVLVTHTLESERQMLAAVRGIAVTRDRSSEFLVESGAAELETLLNRADSGLDEQIAAMKPDDLTASRPRGDRPPRPGLVWLFEIYGHAREHLAQMELTKQLYEAR
jgi:hypothetical protein